mgnify:CR=1 FL=1
MLCDDCKQKPASIYFKDVSGGQIKELHLCEECARKRGLLIDKKLSPIEVLQKMLKKTSHDDDKVICPICFLTLAEFRKIGRFGCSNCLSVFEPFIKTLIKEVQESEKHIGKKAKTSGRRSIEVFKLREELRRALEKESYEDAAQIRDKLKSLGVEDA